jgi:hypothetical protein
MINFGLKIYFNKTGRQMKKLFILVAVSSAAMLYTHAVFAGSVKSDSFVLGLVGQKPVEVEDVSASYGMPTKIYYFSPVLSAGLDVQLNKQTVEVSWSFGRTEEVKENQKGERQATNIAKGLLGDKAVELLISPMLKRMAISQITINGITVKNAKCGQITCRYTVVR